MKENRKVRFWGYFQTAALVIFFTIMIIKTIMGSDLDHLYSVSKKPSVVNDTWKPTDANNPKGAGTYTDTVRWFGWMMIASVAIFAVAQIGLWVVAYKQSRRVEDSEYQKMMRTSSLVSIIGLGLVSAILSHIIYNKEKDKFAHQAD